MTYMLLLRPLQKRECEIAFFCVYFAVMRFFFFLVKSRLLHKTMFLKEKLLFSVIFRSFRLDIIIRSVTKE